MLIRQGFRFSIDLDIGNAFAQSALCITILFKELWNSRG